MKDNNQLDQTDVVVDDSKLSLDERIILRCRHARVFESKGEYENAKAVLSPFWNDPANKGLSKETTAQLLLRVGTLTGWLGNLKRIENAQENAKDLISQSLTAFERLNQESEVAEAQTELAYCYWREGAFDEARILLDQALNRTSESDSEVRLVALLRRALVESSATRFNDSLRILLDTAPLFEKSDNDTLKGRFHNELAYDFQSLASTENRSDYTDRALVEFTAASYHFERAGHTRYRAHVENNLGLLFYTLGRYSEAHEHLDSARQLYPGVGDAVYAAIVDETRARVFIAQKQFEEARKTAQSSCEVFEKAGELAQLSEAMTTLGTALSRLGRSSDATETYLRAADIAEQGGSVENAGLSLVTLMEEQLTKLGPANLRALYQRADQLLSHSQHPETLSRLRQLARRVLELQTDASSEVDQGTDRLSLIRTLIDRAVTNHHKQVTFADDALEAMDRFFLRDELNMLATIVDESIVDASPDSRITADAIEVVALRGQEPRGNFANPWADFSLKGELREPEKRFIELALKAAEGKISLAARLLGYNHTELLTSIIKSRYPELLAARTPMLPRKRSLIRKPKR